MVAGASVVGKGKGTADLGLVWVVTNFHVMWEKEIWGELLKNVLRFSEMHLQMLGLSCCGIRKTYGSFSISEERDDLFVPVQFHSSVYK